jgi:hypothetical protein
VQQKHDRRACWPGLAVEDVDAIDFDSAVMDDRDRRLFRRAGRRFGKAWMRQRCGRQKRCNKRQGGAEV